MNAWTQEPTSLEEEFCIDKDGQMWIEQWLADAAEPKRSSMTWSDLADDDDSGDNEAYVLLLDWIYQYFVHRTPGMIVLNGDEMVFKIRMVEFSHATKPSWMVCLWLFNFRKQVNEKVLISSIV